MLLSRRRDAAHEQPSRQIATESRLDRSQRSENASGLSDGGGSAGAQPARDTVPASSADSDANRFDGADDTNRRRGISRNEMEELLPMGVFGTAVRCPLPGAVVRVNDLARGRIEIDLIVIV
jgi:hypothetical protein